MPRLSDGAASSSHAAGTTLPRGAGRLARGRNALGAEKERVPEPEHEVGSLIAEPGERGHRREHRAKRESPDRAHAGWRRGTGCSRIGRFTAAASTLRPIAIAHTPS